MWHTCTVEYYTAMIMELEMIVPREVRQTEKDKYHVMPLIRGIQNVIPMNSCTKLK